MLLLGAFQSLLHRYTGQDDVVVGTPVANRTRQEIEGLIGFFANNLVLRVDFSGRPSFREILSRVRGVAVEAYNHQEIPFEKLVDELAPERSLSRSPLFQVVFAVHGGQRGQRGQREMSGGLSLDGLKATPQEGGIRTTRFDLELYLLDEPQGLTAVSFYNADLFDGETVARMLRHFRNLLAAAISNPGVPVRELSLLDRAEREDLLGWSGRGASEPAPLTAAALHHEFEARVKGDPDRVALTLDRDSIRYGELDRRANQLSHRLRDLGVGPEALVGLCLDRSFDLVVSILAVLKAGGAYVPLDPGYPEERLRAMLEDSGARVLLTESAHVEKLPGYAGAVLVLDRERELLGRLPSTPPAVASEPSQLAYVIYTSGSTGKPKGVGVTHENVLRLFSATAPWFGFDSRDVFTLFHSYAFDFSVWELWGALLYGGRLAIVPYWVSRDAEAFYDLLARERVTILNQTPSAFRALVRAEEISGGSELALRRVIFGGEALELKSLLPWTRRHEEERPLLVNMYGITETTVHVTYREIRREDVSGTPGSVIGRPIPDLALFLLDENLEPVPQGVPGEIYVAGEGLARGYLGRPDLTAERFVPNPHTSEPGSRLYRTGDLGRHRANGEVEYLGRIDHQVKVRGFRIELGDIEAALAAHSSVREAVVRVREDESEARRLVAYVVAGEGASGVVLRAHLAERLPEYMMPSAFVFLERLPLTSQGKLDARRLPAPESPRAGIASEVERPETPAESVLIGVWKEVLRLPAVGIRDNFFELGGDSILTIQVVARAKERGLVLTARDLFQNQTIEMLARAARKDESAEVEEGPVTGDSVLLPVQRWFFEREPEDADHYNQAMLFSLPIGFRGDLLDPVLQILHSRHDALRLRFDRAAGTAKGPLRAAHDPGARVAVSSFDLRGLSSERRASAIEKLSAEAQASLDVSRGPLARFVHFDAGPEESGRLLAVIHHLVMDGVSWRILLDDLERVYRDLAAGAAATLPPKTSSYKRFSSRMAEYALSETLESEAPFWLDTLSRGRSAGFPFERAAGEGANLEGDVGRVRGALDEEETRALLQDLPGRYGTEVNDALLTGLLDAVSRLTRRNELYLTLEGHGREELFDDVDVSRTVGWFTSLYPVCLSRKEKQSPVETLHSVKDQLRRIPAKGVGYGLLRYSSPRFAPVLEAQEDPLVSFNYLGQLDGSLSGNGFFRPAPEPIGHARSPRGERRHLVDVTAMVAEGRLRVEWMYAGKLLERRSIESLNEAFLGALRSLLQSDRESELSAYSLSDFPLLDMDRGKLEKLLAKRLSRKD